MTLHSIPDARERGSDQAAERLAHLVRQLRRRSGLTQEQLAERAQLSVRTVRNVEGGSVATPRVSTVRLIAQALAAGEQEAAEMITAAATPWLTGGVQATTGAEHADMRASTSAAGEVPEAPTLTVPAQLPLDVYGFTGRHHELAQLDAILAKRADQPTAVIVSAISGTAGVGKTALAVHWAHRVRDQFPDGQLYVNLRGYDCDQAMTAADALARCLVALGVAGPDIPLDLDDRSARYRTETADRRMLIVLDNASSVEQVRPLLPGSGSCTVVVTSRDSLAGLVAVNGTHRVDLDLLPATDAIALLRQLIGVRVDAEPAAATTLASQCARLPLALRVAAELAVSRPATTLAGLVTELADQQRRLDLLDVTGDPRAAVRVLFSWSYLHLPSETARTFRLVGLSPCPDLDFYAVAALADTSVEHARHALDVLARAHLIHPTSAGRYGMHDLLRAYAIGLATTHNAADDPRVALDRLFDHYVATAADAADALDPATTRHRLPVSPPPTPVPAFEQPDSAREWLDTQRPCLVAVAGHTAAHGWPTHTIRLSITLQGYLAGGHHTDALTIHGHARDSARLAGDRAGEAHAALGLGVAHFRLGRYRAAADHHQHALSLFQQIGDRAGEGQALIHLGVIEERLARYRAAADHHRRALSLFQQIGDRAGEALAHDNLGLVEEWLGRYRAAADHHQHALSLSRQVGDRTGEARALNNLGIIEQRLGQRGPAAAHLRQALAVFRQLGNRTGEAWTLNNLGRFQTRLGHPESAAEDHQRALALARESGDLAGQAWALDGLGAAALAHGDPTAANGYYTAALAADPTAHEQRARAQATRTAPLPTPIAGHTPDPFPGSNRS